MLYVLRLQKDLDMEPRSFGKNLRKTVEDKLHQTMEGTCSGRYGYVIAIVTIDEISDGKVRKDGSGFATFTIKYQALVCRPYKGEVIDCIVTSVSKMGFFADAGPLEVFVSNHLIPDELEFNDSGSCYQSTDGATKIQETTRVRVCIVGVKMDISNIYCVGTIKADYLGVLDEEQL